MRSDSIRNSLRLDADGTLGGGGTGTGGGLGAPNPNAPVRLDAGSPKIQAFTNTGLATAKKHEENWKRSPNATGAGAIHVRTFHCKLSDDAITFIDQQVNEWLDAHPQYEVKFATSNIGEWSGKLGKEPHLVVQVWV
jgi:hypothetical protein